MANDRIHDVSAIIDQAPISKFQKWTIALCGLVAVMDGLDTQAIAFVAPVIAKDWSMDLSSFGTIFGAGLLGLTLGALILGSLADLVGRRIVIIMSTFWFGVFSLLTVYATNSDQLLALRLLTGLGLGGAMPNIIALTSEYSPRRVRATLITLMFCGFPLGAVLGGLASSKLIVLFGWKSVFVLGGVLPLLLVPLLWFALPESIRYMVVKGGEGRKIATILARVDSAGSYRESDEWLKEQAMPGLPARHLFTQGRAAGTLTLWVIFFANLLMVYFLINWLPSVLRQAGLPIERAIIATVLLNVGGIIGGLVLSRVVDRRGPAILSVSYALAALAVAAIGSVGNSIPVIMAVVFVAGFFVLGSQLCMNAIAAAFYPTPMRSTGVGWAMGLGRVGSIVGPVIGGVLLTLGWETATLFFVMAAPAVVAALSVAALMAGHKHRLA